jgi:hypothetical protein
MNDELRETKQLIALLKNQTDVDNILDTIQQLRRLSSGNGKSALFRFTKTVNSSFPTTQPSLPRSLAQSTPCEIHI